MFGRDRNLDCVARFIEEKQDICCGIPDRQWFTMQDLLTPSQVAENRAASKCYNCPSMEISLVRSAAASKGNVEETVQAVDKE